MGGASLEAVLGEERPRRPTGRGSRWTVSAAAHSARHWITSNERLWGRKADPTAGAGNRSGTGEDDRVGQQEEANRLAVEADFDRRLTKPIDPLPIDDLLVSMAYRRWKPVRDLEMRTDISTTTILLASYGTGPCRHGHRSRAQLESRELWLHRCKRCATLVCWFVKDYGCAKPQAGRTGRVEGQVDHWCRRDSRVLPRATRACALGLPVQGAGLEQGVDCEKKAAPGGAARSPSYERGLQPRLLYRRLCGAL